MNFVLLGLGSNSTFKGFNSLELLGLACSKLKFLFTSENPFALSSVYCTKAMYVTDQADFYNMAVCGMVEDSITPHKLLESIHVIEAELGRDRAKEIRFGPRSIDIDIELFGSQTINDSVLQIPHPRLSERAFVLTPMLEILPKSADCINRERFADYLRQLPDQGVRLFLTKTQFQEQFVSEAADGNKQHE